MGTQERLRERIQATLKRVDEDARGTRCLTMAEVTVAINLLKECAALLAADTRPEPPAESEAQTAVEASAAGARKMKRAAAAIRASKSQGGRSFDEYYENLQRGGNPG